MSETKNTKLELRIEGLEKELEDCRVAMRRLFEQDRNQLQDMNKLRETITELQMSFAQLSNAKSMYENTIQRQG